MDEISKKVSDMYGIYPYPIPTSEDRKSTELLNLLRIFCLENSYQLESKKILDAGTGTGHRLTEVASFFRNNDYTAIDFSPRSLEIARKVAIKKSIKNVNFENKNLMNDLSELGKFDIILCMGVLHHTSDPNRGLVNLHKILKDDGMIFLYLYGKLGGMMRMTRKKVVSLLLGNDISDYQKGIRLVKEMKLDTFEYGWNLDYQNEEERDSLIVDSFLHVNEKLYDLDDIDELMSKTDLYGYSIFGMTRSQRGMLFDCRTEPDKINADSNLCNSFIGSPLARRYYKSLGIKERCKLLELLYEPNGYTIIGLTKKAYDSLPEKSRIRHNLITLHTLN